MNLKQILRKKYLKIKRQSLLLSNDKTNAYHYGLRHNLQILISRLLCEKMIKPKNMDHQLFIGTYLPIIQKQIIPPSLSKQFEEKFYIKAKYFTPSFTQQSKQMHFLEYLQTQKKNKQLKLGSFGVKVPIVSVKSQKVDPPSMDFLLVPLICIEERSLQRIGYGGGYYDNFIKENKPKNTISIGIALSFLLFNQDHIARSQLNSKNLCNMSIWNEWDQPLDFAITQTQIIKRKQNQSEQIE